jgi:hypothetical protein
VLCSTAITAATVVALVLGLTARAGAASDGAGASGSGDEIITSILAAGSGSGGGGSAGGGGTTPVCRTHVLSDRQIIYLLHVAANMAELLDASFLEALEAYTNTSVIATAPQVTPSSTTTVPSISSSTSTSTTLPVVTEPTVTYWELTVRICGGVADTMSVRPRTVTNSVLGASALAGDRLRHSTRLPPPVLEMSPPPRLGPFGVITSTIVGEPVFFSVEPPNIVRDTVPFAGRTVEVEATPDHLELFSGEPESAGRIRECRSFGVSYDSDSRASVGEQAGSTDACVLVFERATGAPRRDVWRGYAALEWAGRYRVDGGPWHPLDGLFSTSVFAISVGEVDTVIGNG